jgi:hypothetical protein
LLFLSGPENRYDAILEDQASASAVDNILRIGLERLVPGSRAFLNCRHEAPLGHASKRREIFKFAPNYESGSWDEIDPAAVRRGIQEEAMRGLYREAMERARPPLSPQQEIDRRGRDPSEGWAGR